VKIAMNFFIKLFHFIYLYISDSLKRKQKLPFGILVFVGLPGSGKTLSVVEYLSRVRDLYPGCGIITNFGYKDENAPLASWGDLFKYKHPAGIIFAIDELQLTWESRKWGDFPTEIIHLLTQNRKRAVQFVCTAQSFERIDKVFRELTNYIIECRMLGGRWVWQRAFESADFKRGVDGEYKARSRAWRYNFIATERHFASYDTMQILNRLEKEYYDTESEKKQQAETEAPKARRLAVASIT
jgi:hypothetical protein